jgi:hypothetical protein
MACYQARHHISKNEGFMKIHNDFTLYWRVLASGKRVVYYYAYDENNVRLPGRSTGETTMTAAWTVCNRLMRADRLIPQRGKPFAFGEFAEGFWEHGSDYLQNHEGRADITPLHIANCKKVVANQILSFFADVPLADITHKDINKWLLGFKSRELRLTARLRQKRTRTLTLIRCWGA